MLFPFQLRHLALLPLLSLLFIHQAVADPVVRLSILNTANNSNEIIIAKGIVNVAYQITEDTQRTLHQRDRIQLVSSTNGAVVDTTTRGRSSEGIVTLRIAKQVEGPLLVRYVSRKTNAVIAQSAHADDTNSPTLIAARVASLPELTERIEQLETVAEETQNTTQTLSTDGVSLTLSSVNGAGGGVIALPIGTKGDTGDIGEQGPQGEMGAQGPQGFTGAQGLQGDLGAQGLTGAQGLPGDAGIQGEKGETGPQGIQGATGANGQEGPAGDKGNDGTDSTLAWANFSCPEGESVTGFDTDGLPICLTIPQEGLIYELGEDCVVTTTWDDWDFFIPFSNGDYRFCDFRLNDPRKNQFANAFVYNSNFTGAILTGRSYSFTDFSDSNLTSATFEGASIGSSIFRSANLTDTNFRNASLGGPIFHYANLTDTDFTGATLSGGIDWPTPDLGVFYEATLHGTNFTNASISTTRFVNADLTGAIFTGATLSNNTWISSICPDGTLSDDNGDTCENNLIP